MDDTIRRDEMNRLWADLAVLKMIIAEDVGHRWGPDRVRRWHDRAVHAHESTMTDPAIAANLVRALDNMAEKLLRGATRSNS